MKWGTGIKFLLNEVRNRHHIFIQWSEEKYIIFSLHEVRNSYHIFTQWSEKQASHFLSMQSRICITFVTSSSKQQASYSFVSRCFPWLQYVDYIRPLAALPCWQYQHNLHVSTMKQEQVSLNIMSPLGLLTRDSKLCIISNGHWIYQS